MYRRDDCPGPEGAPAHARRPPARAAPPQRSRRPSIRADRPAAFAPYARISCERTLEKCQQISVSWGGSITLRNAASGDTRIQPMRALIKITDWDFKWQDVYRLKEPLR